jgi:putative hemolysin
MKLVTPKDIIKAVPSLVYAGGEFTASLLYRLMKLDKINAFYEKNQGLPAHEFVDSAMKTLGFHFDVPEDEFRNIPVNGPFITISNHAYGGIDGMILFKLLHSTRPDFKILMNFLLGKIKPIEGYALKVNPFEKISSGQSSYAGLKETLHHLKQGHPIGLFPAGEVASLNINTGNVTDKKWPHSVLKLIRKARVPIIPIYFEGHNGFFFNLLGLIHPMLRTARLPAELFNKTGKTIHVRIGRPISVREQDRLGDINDFGKYLRMRTFSLGIHPEKSKKSYHVSGHCQQPVAPTVQAGLIAEEIGKIKPDCLLFSLNQHCVFCSPSNRIPQIMKELGRLREITYREVGEGTNKPLDLDDFDQYYQQLFIWDDVEKQIIGGYRIGFGNKIIETHGIEGFYISTLFHINDKFLPVLKLSMELGRSFIIKSCQKKPLSLFLLWKGILYLLCKHPEFRYMIGPVSISNTYSDLSKALTVEFLKKNFYNKELAGFITARKKFVPQIPPVIRKKVFHKVTGNKLVNLDNFIQAFEPAFHSPVLLKKYLSVNSEAIGFNVDPFFNYCLDVLIITDILDIPQETIKSLSRELKDHSILERFNSTKSLP